MPTKSKKRIHDLTVDVRFGRVSFGKNVASLPIKIDRDDAEVIELEPMLVGARLDVEINTKHDEDDQGALPGTDPKPIAAIADCRHIGVDTTHVSATLSIMLSDIDRGDLAKFSASKGTLCASRSGDVPAADQTETLPGVE